MRKFTKEEIELCKEDLYGFDDGKVYYWDGEKEFCISDEKELKEFFSGICDWYFKIKDKELLDWINELLGFKEIRNESRKENG